MRINLGVCTQNFPAKNQQRHILRTLTDTCKMQAVFPLSNSAVHSYNYRMETKPPRLSDIFQRLYCDPSVYEPFSRWHPVSFRRVLPFAAPEPVTDDPQLLAAETAHLANPNEQTRRAVVEALARNGVFSPADAANLLPVIDIFDADFFELMGQAYSTAGRFRCALRWYRQWIMELEARPDTQTDSESVYAGVGYCLYSLGLYEEAIAWSKSCIGPAQMVDAVCRTLIGYEAEAQGGRLLAVERSDNRTRYTATTTDPDGPHRVMPRLEPAVKAFAPFQVNHLSWILARDTEPHIEPHGYPFQPEHDAGPLPRHRMNLLLALYGRANVLIESGFKAEAKRLLFEAILLEPMAEFIRERMNELG